MKIVEVTNPTLRAAMHDLRWEIFVVEQDVPWLLEIDAYDFDPRVRHLVACEGPAVVGTVRILPAEDAEGVSIPGHAHLGRLAVRADLRGTGLGRELVRAGEQAALEAFGMTTPTGGREVAVELLGQVQADAFYTRLGYGYASAEVIVDAGIDHREFIRWVRTEGEKSSSPDLH